MTAPWSKLRHRAARLFHAVRGHGDLEDKLFLLGVIGLTLFATLVGTLFYVQHSLGESQRRIAEQALPAVQETDRLKGALGAAFRRQAQVSSTTALDQLESLRDTSAVTTPLRGSASAIGARLSDISPELSDRSRSLDQHVTDFLAADAGLFAAVERRHQLQASFEQELASVSGELRSLVEDSQAVSGMLRLEYVLVLRGIAESLERGAPRMDYVRSAVLGDVRSALDDTAELANAVLTLGWLSGKIGLARSSDAINSLAANELPQNRARIAGLIASLQRRTSSRPEAAARVKILSDRFAALVPKIIDETQPRSLVSLRRKDVAEVAAAAEIRAQAIASANELTGDTAQLQAQVAAVVKESIDSQQLTATTTRLFSVIVTLLGLISCVIGARRIRQGVDLLEVKNRHLTELKDNLEHLNANLESKVAQRTAALVERDRAMQQVLDSMMEGLVTVSLDGSLRPERSHAFRAWFGDPGTARIWDVLFSGDPKRAGLYRCGFEQVADGIFPFEVSIDQLPKQIHRGDRAYELELRAVEREGQLDSVLYVISDITAQLAAAAAERAARDDQRIIAHLLRDRRGFQRSIDEIRSLLGKTRLPNDNSLPRTLHTIKGNAGVLGFSALEKSAHALEEELERDGEVSADGLASLDECFQIGLRRVQEYLEHALGRVDIDARDYALLVDQLKDQRDYREILAQVERWQLEPIANVLHGLAAHARRLAEQMGKRVEVTVNGNGIRVGNEHLRSFCASLVHAIRNALDHGLETPEQRVAAGKPGQGRLQLSAALHTDRLIVTINDDGAGIDLARVQAKAQERGLPVRTRDEVIEAVFAAGLSTRDAATELSGRGVGMGAVRAACRELGGDAKLVTVPGRGTELRCELPASALHADAQPFELAS
jgi:two-component system chemotaxis sensor kinase CheA